MRMRHCLKIWPKQFEAVRINQKRFEIRVNDRDFKEGDLLVLEEWDPTTKTYSGRVVYRVVGFIEKGSWGLPPNLCVMSLEGSALNRPDKAEEGGQ